jgi:hypothetical protein
MSEVKLDTTLIVTGPEPWLPPPEEHAASPEKPSTTAVAASAALAFLVGFLISEYASLSALFALRRWTRGWPAAS